MVQEGNEREQSWRDQLPADELAVTDRLKGMTPQMQSAWLGVEIFRVRKEVKELASTLQTTIKETNKATADAIVAGVKAANPIPINGKTAHLSPTTATFLMGLGVVIGGIVAAIGQRI